ncbi:hypothetical protein QQZ08_011479 [Neonectria magnoliae]|uniref:Uncharacterized protein n=1 Tax=Neonectria magnoliae TaxID=2732573 RepID=A0ABR1HA74_9HYPO
MATQSQNKANDDIALQTAPVPGQDNQQQQPLADDANIAPTPVIIFVKWLGQSNITNAYNSGMKEDLDIKGIRYNSFSTFYSIGAVFAGYMQAAPHAGLDGKLGMEGWRWVFVVDGISSLPIALAGFFLSPGLPTSPGIWWLKDGEQKLALAQMRNDGVRKTSKIGKRMLKRSLATSTSTSPYWCTTWVTGQMGIWVKSTGQYSVELINILPTGTQLMVIVCGSLVLQFVMVYPVWMLVLFTGAIMIFSNICLRIWYTPIGSKFTSWFLLGFNSCVTSILFPFIHLIMEDDNEAKSFTTDAMVSNSSTFKLSLRHD